MELLWRERAAFGYDRLAILTVEIRALVGTVVQIRNSHVCPINVPCLSVNDHAIWDSASGYDDLSIRAVGIYRDDATTAACLQKK